MEVTKLATNEKRKCKAADVYHEFPAKPQSNNGLKAFALLKRALLKSANKEAQKLCSNKPNAIVFTTKPNTKEA